jgi:hypothetical protein
VAVAAEREVEWRAVDWEELRGQRERVIAALPALRATLESGDGESSVGGGALSLRERVGVRGDRARAEIFDALAANSPTASAAAARQLAGLGEGSTPAGDDFLVGVMYALRAFAPENRADSLCTAIAEAAVPLTTRRSAAWLQHASAGDAIPTWNLFLSSLASGDDATIRERGQGVLALGHTSGRAALSGFVAALDILGGSP